MKVKNGESRLTEVLYVPDLGVNLLSARRFTKYGLRGSFNNDGLYMHTRKGIEALRAPARGGIYIVDKVAPELDEFAYVGSSSKDQTALGNQGMPAVAASDSEEMEKPPSVPEPQQLVAPDPMPMPQDPLEPQQPKPNNEAPRKRDLYTLWHRRLGHLGSAKIRNLHKVTTLKKPIPIVETDAPCEVCAITKMTNKRNRTLAERRPRILALVSIDICGPLPIFRLGYEYFLEIIDNYSRRTWIILLRKRSDAPEALRKWKLRIELQCSAKVQAVRSDNATELRSTLDEWCASIDIEPEYTVAYNSIQNGVVERGIRTTENQFRAMLQDAGLPLEFWPEAAEADSYVRNRVATGPVIKRELINPIEAFINVKPSIDHLRVWGCKCYSPIDTRSLSSGERTDKLVNRGRPGVFMGYDESTSAHYRIWASDRQEVIKHHKVTFSENENWGSAPLNLKVATPNVLGPRRSVGRPRKTAIVTPDVAINPNVVPEPMIIEPAEVTPTNTGNWQASSVEDHGPEAISETSPRSHPDLVESKDYVDDVDDSFEVNELIAESTIHTRAKLAALTVSPPKKVQQFLHVAIPKRKRIDSTDEDERDEHRDKIARAMLALLGEESDVIETKEWALAAVVDNSDKMFVDRLVIPVPESYEQAIKDPIWGQLWKEAIQAELTALISNGTWEAVVPPKGANLVTSKWVFKAKMHIDGTLEKLKARIVARGFSQMYGIDYTDTFAPTVKFDTLRLFLVIVALEDLECHQVDVNNAFTESFLQEVIYMAPPPGVDLPPGQALLIRRSLYGLKQAARDWHKRCAKELKKLGFEQCAADPCMLRHKERGIYLLIYVDDIAVAARTLDQVQWFKGEFSKVFKVKDLGEMKKILGIRITRNRRKRTLRMDQSHYLSELALSVRAAR